MDREKVIKAYECCKNSYDRICEKCPYEKDCCHDGIPMFVIKKMVELIKEQEARWISVPHKRARICSHCEADEPYKFADDDAEVYEYCPHCGAKMTEGR